MSSTPRMPPHLEYFDRLIQLDRQGAMTLVERFLAHHKGDVAGLYDEVLVPALIHTGREWQGGRISVAHEHYISEVTRDLILRHGPKLRPSPDAIKGTAVACCAPSERHVLGLMMASDILRATGLEVHLLGEGAPSEAVRGFVDEFKADVLALSISLSEHLDEAVGMIEQSRSVRPSLIVIAGGRAFSGLSDPAARIGADLVIRDLRELHRRLSDLLPDRLGLSS